MSTFAGKIALVTGGGRGIGRAACNLLAKNGAYVVAVDRNFESAQDTVHQLPGQQHLALACDVSCSKSVEECFSKAMQEYNKPVTLLSNAAGITDDAFIKKMSEQQFENVLSVNLKGTFLMTQCFARSLAVFCGEEKAIPGAVVNVSSVVTKGGNMGQGNYAASKAGVEAFSKTAAKELARQSIRVNCVSPGFISTPMVESVPEHIKDFMVQMIPARRMGEPHEVAEAISFLLSDQASYISGACLDVTGGLGGTM